MAHGTHEYGMVMGWRGRRSYSSDSTNSVTECTRKHDVDFKKKMCVQDCEVTYIHCIKGQRNSIACIGLSIELNLANSNRHKAKQKIFVQPDLLLKLYWRYSVTQKKFPMVAQHSRSSKENNSSVLCEALQSETHSMFIENVTALMKRKLAMRHCHTSRTVTPSLYSLWLITCSITVELFADSLNESGVLQSYCSEDKDYQIFGALAEWKSVERTTEGGGGNPPYEADFICDMIKEFDSGSRGTAPYCRCVLLPLAEKYRVLQKTTSLMSKGIMLIRIPPGCLAFNYQEGYFLPKPIRKCHAYQELGVFVWRNREYLEKYAPPSDVEHLFLRWVSLACRLPSTVHVDLQALKRAFPPSLRRSSRSLELLIAPSK